MYIVSGSHREPKFCIPGVLQGLIKAGYYGDVIWVFFDRSSLSVSLDLGSNVQRCCSESWVFVWW